MVSRGKNRGGAPGDRQAAKEERVAMQEQARRARERAALWKRVTKYAVIILVIGGLAALLFIPRKGSYVAGGRGDLIDGVQTYRNPTGHTESFVAYPQTPPVGGEHHPTWLNCGIYD